VLAAIEADLQPLGHALGQVALGKLNPLLLADAWSKDGAADLFDRWLRYLPRMLWLRRTVAAPADDPIAGVLIAAVAAASEERLVSMWQQLTRDRELVRGTTNPNLRLLLESRLLAWRDLGTV
jgi:hypothetical protein